MKAYRIIHITANIIAFGALFAALIFMLISWGGLADTVGVHFDPEGEFDVFADKKFAFYPFVAGFGLLGIFSLLSLGVNKIKKLGFGLNGKNEMIFRRGATLFLDAIKLIWAAFFSVWTYCVIVQVGMRDYFPLKTLRTIMMLLLLPVLLIALGAAVSASYSKKFERHRELFLKQARIRHISLNAAAFTSLTAFLLKTLLAYKRLPVRIGVHFGAHGEFDVYSHKLLAFYPFVAGFGLMILFSLLSLGVNKVKKTGLKVTEDGEKLIRMIATETLDIFKFMWALFFSVWSYHVVTQTAGSELFLGMVSTAFLVILVLSPTTIIFTAKRYSTKKQDAAKETEE